MIFYKWNEQGIFFGQVEIDESAALPARSTPTQPPELEGDEVARWTGSGWEVLAAAPEPEPLPAPDWPALIAARRYSAETAGTTVEGMPIDTGRDSQGLITGAALAAMLGPAYSIRWKTVAGYGNSATGCTSVARSVARKRTPFCTGHCAQRVSLDGEPGCFEPASELWAPSTTLRPRPVRGFRRLEIEKTKLR